MSKKQNRRRGISLGTDVGVFSGTANWVGVQFFEGPRTQHLQFNYSTTAAAENALAVLEAALESEAHVAKELRREYSIEHMLDLLRKFLPRLQLDGASRETEIRVSSAGLQCRSLSGEWKSVLVDNVAANSPFQPTGQDKTDLSYYAEVLYRRYCLEPGQVWEAVGRVYEHDLPSQLLGFPK